MYLKKNIKKIYYLGFFFLFLKVLKVRCPAVKTSNFRTVRILKICWTSGLDVMSGRALKMSVIWLSKICAIIFCCFYSYVHSTLNAKLCNHIALVEWKAGCFCEWNSDWNSWQILLLSAYLTKFWMSKLRYSQKICQTSRWQQNSWRIPNKFQSHLLSQYGLEEFHILLEFFCAG